MYNEDDEGDETLKKDMLWRQARVLYPELEEWLLEMVVNIHLAQEPNPQNPPDGKTPPHAKPSKSTKSRQTLSILSNPNTLYHSRLWA